MTIREIGGGDEQFEAIYRKHARKMFSYFRSCRVSDDEAQDLLQDTFIRFFERREQLRGTDEGPFLRAIARTVLLNFIRERNTGKRKGLEVRIDDPDVGFDPPAPPLPDYAERQQTETRQRLLREGLAQLPESQRECMQQWLANVPYHEIARDLGITMDAVKTRIKNAKKSLSARLGETIPEDDE